MHAKSSWYVALVRSRPTWDVLLVTVLIGAVAIALVEPQLAPDANALPSLSRRATMLRQISDAVERDKLCTPLAASARAVDRALAPDVKVFLSGIVGAENGARLPYYYFLRNYLFPRTVEISRNGNAIFREYWFEGVPCNSPDDLRADGFDLMLRFAADGKLQAVPLTPKGALR